MVHLEFAVLGRPISHQTGRKPKLRAWQAAFRAEAARLWAGAPLTGKLKFMVINFHEGDDPGLDDDNMVKPVRDALNKLVYVDDRQIRHSETWHVPIDQPVKARRASRTIWTALEFGAAFVYVRVEDAAPFIQLPS